MSAKPPKELWRRCGGDLRQAAEAQEGPAALLSFAVDLAEGNVENERVPRVLGLAWDLLFARVAPETVGCRRGWRGFAAVLPGARAEIVELLREFLGDLLRDPGFAGVRAQVVLTRVFRGEVARTFSCDPGYDLQDLRGSYLVWVEPHDKDDWRESQRYPTTEVCWQQA